MLTGNPAGTPYLVNVTTVNNIRYAQLAENYYAYSPLDFLFVSKGAGQQNQVKSYDGATHTVSVNTEWTTVPDTTSWYTISVDEGNGTAQGATIYSIVLAETAMAEDGYYNGMEISIIVVSRQRGKRPGFHFGARSVPDTADKKARARGDAGAFSSAALGLNRGRNLATHWRLPPGVRIPAASRLGVLRFRRPASAVWSPTTQLCAKTRRKNERMRRSAC